jgi:phage repressor protein C with HTH and peptisase S24 domain
VSLEWLATGRDPTESRAPAIGAEPTAKRPPTPSRESRDACDRGDAHDAAAALDAADAHDLAPARDAPSARGPATERSAAAARGARTQRESVDARGATAERELVDERQAGVGPAASGDAAAAHSTPDGHRRATLRGRPTGSSGESPRDRALQGGAPGVAYDEYTFVPRERARVLDGKGMVIRSAQVVDSLAFKTEWVRRRLIAAPRNLMLVEVIGDSMAPTLEDSDLILVDLGEPRFKQDGVYVLRRDTELVVKRLQRRPDGKLIIRSDNPAYETTLVSRESLGIIGRVIWAAGRI